MSELPVKIVAVVISLISLVISISAVRIANAKNRADIICRMFKKYQQIMKKRRHAIEKKESEAYANHFKELFDLLWLEYRLWQYRLIPDDIIRIWFSSKYPLYAGYEDREFDRNKVIYRQVWEELVEDKYFSKDDGFVDVMDGLHSIFEKKMGSDLPHCAARDLKDLFKKRKKVRWYAIFR